MSLSRRKFLELTGSAAIKARDFTFTSLSDAV